MPASSLSCNQPDVHGQHARCVSLNCCSIECVLSLSLTLSLSLSLCVCVCVSLSMGPAPPPLSRSLAFSLCLSLCVSVSVSVSVSLSLSLSLSLSRSLSLSPRVHVRPMGHTCGKPTEIELTAIVFPNLFAATTTTRGCPAPPADFTQQGRGCPSSGCANGNCCTNALNKNVGLSSFTEAWAVCGTLPDCAHILAYKDGKFYLRKESDPVVPAAAPNGVGADHSRSMEYTCKGMLHPFCVAASAGATGVPLGTAMPCLALLNCAPWGVRAESQTKSRKIPTRKILPGFYLIRR